MDDDWDLHAVVRGYTAATVSTTTTTTTTNNPLPTLPLQHSSFDDANNNHHFQGLQEIYREFCTSDPPPPAIPAFQEMNMQIQENAQFNNLSIGSSSQSLSQPIRPRRRKNQQVKMVRQMTEEDLSADSWAWRKYGQKPIKGSPFPRNYYRCSTSKGCAARKQVERSPNDPGIFVVSYTGDHTHPRPSHRSSLAGSTRNRFFRNNAQKGPVSSASPNTPLMEEMVEDEENMLMIANELMNDDDDDDDNDDDGTQSLRGFQDSDHSSGGLPWSPTTGGDA